MPTASFDRYYLYGEITNYLKELQAQHPNLVSLGTMGKSYEGRDIWMVTITDLATGPAAEKPAMYVDGNIHAGEVTASMTCLYAINHLVTNHGKDERITDLLRRRAFYIAPRVNPDGAELYLTTPTMLRSSVRIWPDQCLADLPGLHPSDVDGDGLIMEMRVRDDELGEWRVSDRDPRLMVPRCPDDRGGAYYRIYPEGMIKDYQGKPFEIRPVPYGLDMNRNFPSNWKPELHGGGEYPAQEPETRAIVDFILSHPNIGGLLAFHTSGGILFRAPYGYTDADMDPDDLRVYLEVAMLGTRDSGYPEVASGRGYGSTIVEWAYEHRGIIGFTPELWDMAGRAGVGRDEAQKATTREQREAVELKFLTWNDRELAGKGFFNWKPFNHPQLGPVEIGGWHPKFVRQNPPPKLLEQECHKNAMFVLRHAAALPEVDVAGVILEQVGSSNAYHVTATVINRGFLPTCICNKGRKPGVVKPDRVRLDLGSGWRLVSGTREQEIGHLDGFSAGQRPGWGRAMPAKSMIKVDWVIARAEGVADAPASQVTVTAVSCRGGVASEQAKLAD
jgi:murein tripeptide amidase MpaA